MNTSVTLTSPALGLASGASMPASRLVHAYYTEAKYEFLKMLRTPAFAVPILVLPVVMYVLFGLIMSAEAIAKNAALGVYLFCGFSVFAVTGPGLLGVCISLAHEKDAGLLKLKRALPAPPGAYILAKMLVAMAFTLIATSSVIVTALLLGKLPIPLVLAPALLGTLVLGALPMAAIGLFVGAYATGSSAPAFGNLVFLPMLWLSGLFIPLPKAMQSQVVIWPAFHLDQLAVAVLGLKEFRFMSPGISALVLIGVTALFGALALRRLARK
jgi:ABC-2 type transport system permease protein